MTSSPSFIVYNASAGSGKTYALVKNYLLAALKGPGPDNYKHLLAITFTNKAVAEMKQRIIEHLEAFSKYQDGQPLGSMQFELCESLAISPLKLKDKAGQVLKSLLHNYAGFSVETIDSFNHRLLRTFAKDMGLKSNFEVSLDVDLLLHQAVDRVLSKAGSNSALTQTLIDFALYKTAQDKSWDVSFDLLKIAKILVNETDYPHTKQLQEVDQEAFKCLEKTLDKKITAHTTQSVTAAQQALALISNHGIEQASFNRGLLPKYFVNVVANKFPAKWDAAWMLNLEEKPLYPAKASPEQQAAINAIAPELVALFNTSKQAIFELQFAQMLYNELTPHAVLKYIIEAFEEIKTEQNTIPISAFNRQIHEQIKNQPAPFIYERLGEWYQQFYVDEFQDTSRMQWENLSPLIENALSQEFSSGQAGSLLLVGDPKQSIYRWRGGEPEQFIALSQGQSDFTVPPQLVKLKKNYRSHKEVIAFNNQFFTQVAQFLALEQYQQLYQQDCDQLFNERQQGYVQLDFIPPGLKAALEPQYLEHVISHVKSSIAQGYGLKDICILTRTKAQNSSIANALREENIVFVSAESVLLKNSPLVRLLIALLRLNTNPQNKEFQLEFYSLLQHCCFNNYPLHDILTKAIDNQGGNLTQTLTGFGFNFNTQTLNSLGLYDALEYSIRALKIEPKITAYERFLLDVAHDFEQRKEASFSAFLDFWDTKKDALSVQFPEGMNAVQLMTIHKAKGLEFPVVIFPFADASLQRMMDHRVWFPLDPENACGFKEFQLPFSKKISSIDAYGEALYEQQMQQQFFDQLNVLYVALTRAANVLYIITTAKGPETATYGGLFAHYLDSLGQWNPAQLQYGFGLLTTPDSPQQPKAPNLELPFIGAAKESHNIQLVAAPTKTVFDLKFKARLRGQRLHDLLAHIITKDDIAPLFERQKALGQTALSQLQQEQLSIEAVVNHPELSPYFSATYSVKNEVDLIDLAGNLHRPDRLCFTKKSQVIIIDYKFGQADSSYRTQVDSYAQVLQTMGFTVAHKILVYCNQKIHLDTW